MLLDTVCGWGAFPRPCRSYLRCYTQHICTGITEALLPAALNHFYSLSWDLCTDPCDYLHALG